MSLPDERRGHALLPHIALPDYCAIGLFRPVFAELGPEDIHPSHAQAD